MSEFRAKSFVLNFIRKHILLSFLLILSVILAALSGLLPPFMLRYLLDEYFKDLQTISSLNATGILFSILYFLSYFLVGLCTILENLMIGIFGQKMIHELRYQMIKKSVRLKASYFTAHGSGEMQSQVMDDVASIETLFASGIISIAASLIKVIGILVSLFTFSWILGLLIFALVPVIFLLTILFRKAMLKAHLKNRKLINRQANEVSETIDSIRTIQNLSKEDYRENRYQNLLFESYRMRNKTAIYDSIFSPILEIFKSLLIVAVTYLVLFSLNSDRIWLSSFSIGTFAASLNFISNIFSPIEEIAREIETMQEGSSGLRRVQAFMNEEEANEKDSSLTANHIFATNSKTILQIDHLSFRYDDGDKNIFNDLNFAIEKGEKVTIIGRTGVGKTTLFRLILGLYHPVEGRILLNGYDASLIPDKEKRNIFGYVEQGFASVTGTILEQITLSDPSISIESVRDVMKQVGLDDYVTKEIKNGYNEPFSESLFSRGQLQLLSLARALVSNPKILLLDEISANLDSKTEKQIIDALYHATSKRTVISISHRLSDQLGFDRTIEIR